MNTSTKNLYKACSWYASLMSQISAYNWDADFCVKEAKDYEAKVVKYVKENVKISEVAIGDLLNVGFQFYGDDHSLLLCPLWLHKVYFPNRDNDNRCGCLAYGFKVKLSAEQGCILDT